MTRRDRTVLALLVSSWALAYLPPLLSHRILPARDIGATQAPWRAVWREQVLEGQLPLWDPRSSQGRPLLANPNAMALYPGTLLCLAMSPEAAVSWHLAGHHLLLLLACTAIARRAGASFGAASVAGAATATTGVAWSMLTLVNSQASLAWTAVAVATAVPSPSASASPRRALLGGAALGVSFLAGEPVIAALGALAWTVVAITLWRPRHLAPVAIAAAAAVGVAAPVLLPLLATYGDTVRATLGVAPGALAADALAPRRWPELLLPSLLGNPLADRDGGFWAAASFPWQRYFPLVFIGALPLMALPFARSSRCRLTPWWALAVTGALGSILLGWPAAAALAAGIPGVATARYGIKLLLLTLLALPPLLAAGLERLLEVPARRRRAATGVLVSAAVLAGVGTFTPAATRSALARFYPSSRAGLADVPDALLRGSLLRDAAALALPAGALLATPTAAPLCAAVMVAGYLGGRPVLAFDGADRWRDAPTLAQGLPQGATVAAFASAGADDDGSADASLARFRASRAALVPEYGVRWGLTYVLTRGPDGLEPLLQELVADEAGGLEPAARARVARALGAHAVIDAAPLVGFTSRQVAGVWLAPLNEEAPVAYLAQRALEAEGVQATVRALAEVGFRPGVDAVVGGNGPARVLGGGTLVAEATSIAARRRYTVTSDGPGLLVVRQSMMRCWKARIDGVPARLETVNGSQIGVRVPDGTHRVELFVERRLVYLGLCGPLLVALVILATRRAAASRGLPAATGGGERSTPATRPAP